MRPACGAGHRTSTVSVIKRMNWIRVGLFCVLLVSFVAGCHRQGGVVMGKAPKGESKTILAVKAGDTPPQVILTGEMIEKCPAAGCWFRLRDETGSIKVDTRASGFVVVNVPLNAKVVVAGKVVADGNDTAIQATGIRY